MLLCHLFKIWNGLKNFFDLSDSKCPHSALQNIQRSPIKFWRKWRMTVAWCGNWNCLSPVNPASRLVCRDIFPIESLYVCVVCVDRGKHCNGETVKKLTIVCSLNCEVAEFWKLFQGFSHQVKLLGIMLYNSDRLLAKYLRTVLCV